MLVVPARSPAWAQAAPSTVDPGRIQERLRPPPRPEPEPVPIPTQPTVKDEPVARKQFTLRRVVLAGASAYSREALAPLWAPLLNRRIRVRDIYELSNRIVARYKADGYALVSVVLPQQDFDDGVARLRVIEGHVSDVVIQGETNTSRSLAVLQGYARRIAADRPLRRSTLERYLLLANELPGVTVGSRFARSQTPGAVRLVLTVAHEPLNLVAGIDNHGTDEIGPIQLQTGVAQNGLLLFGDQTRFQYAFTTRWNELHFFDLSHSVPLGFDGLRLSLGGFYLRTRPELLDLRGEATGGHLSLSYPIVRSVAFNLDVFASFSVLDSDTDLVTFDLIDDRLRVLRLGAAVSAIDDWKGRSSANLIFSHGVDVFGASGNSTRDGRPDFSKLTLGLERTQLLFDGVSLNLRASGQFAFDSLLSAERFGVGGREFGRAFDSSATTGDHGIGFSAELRYAPDWLRIGNILRRSEIYAFADWARVWNRASGDRPPFRSGLSAGMGVRLGVTKYLSAGVEAAAPVFRTGVRPGQKKRSGFRVFFKLRARYGF